MRVRDEDIRPGGYISGPTIFGAADCAMWFAVSGALGKAEPMSLTSELSIRFLRPGLGQTLLSRADIDRVGTTSVVATIRVWTSDESKPVAVAQGTYALPRP
jgi:uncharacterized protein (TIGR00369 family)